MSTSIDERVVRMRFDNADFEKRANSTIGVLERLKQKLTFKGTSDAIAEVQKDINSLSFNQFSKSADNLGDVLSTKVIAKLEIMRNLVGRVTDAGVNMVKSLSVDQVSSGFSKYEQKLANTQAIMNATKKPLEEVNKELDKLMWYTDETSYSFTDMANTIGRFTSYNIPLDKAVTSIIGIGNAAGLAGASIQDASHAMQGFAKGIGSAMDTADWQWIETAHMDTAEFKKQLLESGVAMKMLKKASDGTYRTLKGTVVDIESFRSSISEKWITGDVLTDTFSKFGQYTEEVYKLTQQGYATAEAMDMLSGKFDEVGERGMRASQESKTFADAISAVKDAISSGWMVTFETLFGNFEEAKDVWAAMYDELYDLFALSGETRNELLTGWKDAGGRDLLFETIAEGWQKVKDILDVVREASEEIFPPKTAEDLIKLTKAFKDFVSQFKLSKDAMYSLKVIFKAILLPVKLVTNAIKVAASFLKLFAISAIKVSDILLTMASNTEYARKVFQKVFGDVQGARIFDSLSIIIGNVSNKIKELKDRFNEMKIDFSKGEGLFSSLMNGLNKFADDAIELFADILEGIATGDWSKFFAKLEDGFSSINDSIYKCSETVYNMISRFAEFAGIKLPEMSEITDFINNFIEKIPLVTEGFDTIKEKSGTVAEFLMNVAQAVVDFTSKLSPAEILISGVGLAIITLIFQISNFVGASAEAVKGFKTLTKSAGAMFNAIKTRFDPTYKSLKTAGDTAVKIGAAFILLAAALTALSKVPSDDLREMAISLSILIGVIAGATGVLMGLNILSSKLGARTAGLNGVAGILLGFSASLATFALAMNLLKDVKVNDNMFKAWMGVMTALLVLALAVGGISKVENKFQKGTKTILAMAASLYIIALAMNKLDPNNLGAKFIAMVGMMGAMSMVLVASSIAGEHSAKAIKSLSKLSFALLLMTGVFELIGLIAKLDPETMFMGVIISLAEVFGLMIPVMIAANLLGKYMDNATKGLSRVAKTMTLLIIPIYLFGKMDKGVLAQGKATVFSIIGVYAAISTLMGFIQTALKITGGSFSKDMISLAASIDLLILAVAALGYLDTGAVAQGVIAVGALLGFIGLMIRISGENKKAETSIKNLTGVIAAFAIAVAALSVVAALNPAGFWQAMAGMILGMLTMMAMMSQLEKENFKGAIGALLSVISIIGIIATTLLMTKDMSGDDAIKKLGGLALVVASMALVARAISGKDKNKKADWKKARDQAIKMGAFIGVATAAVILVGRFGDSNSEKVLVNAGALSGVILAMATAARIMNGTGKEGPADWKKAVEDAGSMLAFVGTATLAVIALGKWGGSDAEQVKANAYGLSAVILAMAGAVKIMNNTKWDHDLNTKAGWMLAFIGTATGAMLLLGNFGGSDPVKVGVNAAALSGILLSTAVAVRIMNRTDFNMGLGQAAVMALLIAGIAGSMLILAEVKTDGMFEKAIALVTILGGLTAVVEVLSKFPVDPAVVLSGLTAMGEVLLGIAAVLGILIAVGVIINAISYVTKKAFGLDLKQSILDGVQTIGDIIVAFADIIGSAIGTFLASLTEATLSKADLIGQHVADFMNNLATGTEAVKGFDETAQANFTKILNSVASLLVLMTTDGADKSDRLIALGENLVAFSQSLVSFALAVSVSPIDQAIKGIEATKILAEAITMIPVNEKNMPDLDAFGSQLETFAPHLKAFVEAVSQAKADSKTVDAATNAGKAVAEMAKELGQQGVYGSLDLYSSENGNGLLSKFGTEIANFAPKLKKFVNDTEGITKADVDGAIDAAKVVAGFASNLPTDGGAIDFWTGRTITLSEFAGELETFGPKFKAYANEMASVSDWSGVKESATVAQAVADFANKLPSTGGKLQEWVGEKKLLSTFGDELTAFGPSFATYASNVAGIKKSDVTGATEAAKDVITLYSELPTSGGWLDFMLGNGEKITLDTFAAGMQSLGWAIKSYNANVSDISNIAPSVRAIQLIVDLSNNLGDFKKNNVDKFTTSLGSLADAGVDKFVNAISSSSSDLKNAGSEMIDNFISGMESKDSDIAKRTKSIVAIIADELNAAKGNRALTNAGMAVANKIANDISNSTKYTEAGATTIDLIVQGMNNRMEHLDSRLSEGFKKVSDTLIDILKKLRKQFDDATKDADDIGINIMKGIVKGLKAEKGNTIKQAKTIAKEIILAMMKALEIHSPSKVAERDIGGNVDKGVASGLIKYFYVIAKAAKQTGSKIITGINEGIREKAGNNVSSIILDILKSRNDREFYDQGNKDGTDYAKGMVAGLKAMAPLDTVLSKMKIPTSSALFTVNSLGKNVTVSPEVQKHTSLMVNTFEDYLDYGNSSIKMMEKFNKESSKLGDDKSIKTMQNAINAIGMSEVVTTFHDEINNMYGLNTLIGDAEQMNEARIKALTKRLNSQAEVVEKAKSDYISSVAAHGKESDEAANKFLNYAKERDTLAILNNQLTAANNIAVGHYTQYAKMFLNEYDALEAKYTQKVTENLSESQKELLATAEYHMSLYNSSLGEESEAVLSMVEKLRADIADGIINDTDIISAIQDKMSDILSIFSDMSDQIDLKFNIVDKEYSLWEKTEGLNASERDKLLKKQELQEREMNSVATKIRLQEMAYSKAVELMGADSQAAYEEKVKLLDLQTELADLASDYAQVIMDLETAQETAIDKTKTPYELAMEELEEWKKDGSFKEWTDFGATEQELIDALIDKYEKKAKDQEAKDAKEAKAEQVKWEKVQEIMNNALGGVDINSLDAMVHKNMTEMVKLWASEAFQNNQNGGGYSTGYDPYGSYAASGGYTGVSDSTVSDSTKAVINAVKEQPKALLKMVNTLTGEVKEIAMTKEEASQFHLNRAGASGWMIGMTVEEYKKAWKDAEDQFAIDEFGRNWDTNSSQLYEKVIASAGGQMASEERVATLAYYQSGMNKIRDVLLNQEKNGETYMRLLIKAQQEDALNGDIYYRTAQRDVLEEVLGKVGYTMDQWDDMMRKFTKMGLSDDYFAILDFFSQDFTKATKMTTEELQSYRQPYKYTNIDGGDKYTTDVVSTTKYGEFNKAGFVAMKGPDGFWYRVPISQFDEYLKKGYTYRQSQFTQTTTSQYEGDAGKDYMMYQAGVYDKIADMLGPNADASSKEFREMIAQVKDAMEVTRTDAEGREFYEYMKFSNGSYEYGLDEFLQGLQRSTAEGAYQGSYSGVIDANYGTYSMPDYSQMLVTPEINTENITEQVKNSVTDGIKETVEDFTGGGFMKQVSDKIDSITGGSDDWAEGISNKIGEWGDKLSNFMGNAEEDGKEDGIKYANGMYNGLVAFNQSVKPDFYKTPSQDGANVYADGFIEGIQARYPDIQAALISAVSSYQASLGLTSQNGSNIKGLSNVLALAQIASTLDGGSGNRNAPVVESKYSTQGISIGRTLQQTTEVSKAIMARLGDISTEKDTKAPATPVVNNNFTQNNYSPKALSRYDIYRDTRNQISRLKGVVSV